MATLPNDADLTGASVTEGQFKTKLAQTLAFLRGIVGTTGVPADAVAALGLAGTVTEAGRAGSVADAVAARVPSGVQFRPLPPESGYIGSWEDPISRRSCLLIRVDGRLEVGDILLPDSSVARDKLDSGLRSLVPTVMPIESGYVLGFGDPVTQRYPVRIRIDGAFEVDNLVVGAGVITLANLSLSLQGMIPVSLPPESGYVAAWGDPSTKRYPVRITTTGAFEADGFSPSPSTVSIDSFTAATSRRVVPQISDVQSVLPDVWRGAMGGTAAKTIGDGTAWVALGALATRHLTGVPNASISLQFRRSAGLPIIGSCYGGSIDAAAVQAVNLRGVINVAAQTTPTGTFAAGDYFRYGYFGEVGTYNGSPIYVGDLIVYNGSSWSIKSLPKAYDQRDRGMWFDITSAGYWDGVQCAAGDRVLYIGRETGGAGPRTEIWTLHKAASASMYYYRGEFNPASGLPTSPLPFDLYQASAAGSAGGFTFAAGDYLLREGSAWCLAAQSSPITVAAGSAVALPCAATAAEWEVRRTDKGNARADARLRALAMSIQRAPRDEIFILGDSMPGAGGAPGSAILSAAGRTGIVASYGGASSEQVLSMWEKEIVRNPGVYDGRTLIAWHGQNNNGDLAQIISVSLRLAQLVGARDGKVLFLSVLGTRAATWNGTRLVINDQEEQMAGSGVRAALNAWYAATFPGRWISPYWALLSAATDAPDPTFPGMTEKQVASTYGIVPWSFFGSLATPTSSLVFQGYRSAAGLPTGGANGDYVLRTANGKVGNVIVREAGVWVEYELDGVHITAAGAQALANGGPGFGTVPAHAGVAGFLVNNLF